MRTSSSSSTFSLTDRLSAVLVRVHATNLVNMMDMVNMLSELARAHMWCYTTVCRIVRSCMVAVVQCAACRVYRVTGVKIAFLLVWWTRTLHVGTCTANDYCRWVDMSNANRISIISIIECAEFAGVATFCIILYYIVLYRITLYYIVLYCTILYHCIVSCRIMYGMYMYGLYLLYGCIYCIYWIYCVYCVYCMECMRRVNPLTRRSVGSRAALICCVNFCNKIFATQFVDCSC